jgi:hypothetical protein
MRKSASSIADSAAIESQLFTEIQNDSNHDMEMDDNVGERAMVASRDRWQ